MNIGVIINSKGLNGCLILANSPKTLALQSGTPLHIGYSDNYTDEYVLANDFQSQARNSEIYLQSINTKEKAMALKERAVFADKADILKQNPYYFLPDDIIGCKVYDIGQKEVIGEIVEILELPANDVWLVTTARGELPLPVIDDVVKDIDVERGVVEVVMLDGLWDIVSVD
jgi:16S rRNA processing protein RimM